MAITYQSPYSAQLAAKTGEVIRAKKESMMVRNLLAQRELEDHKFALRLEAMKQQAALQEQAQIRGQQLQMEMAEARIQNDFIRSERKREQEIAERESKIKALEKAVDAGQITMEERDLELAKLQIETGIPFFTQSQISERTAATQAAIAERQDEGMSPTQIVYASKQLEKLAPGEQPRDWTTGFLKRKPLTETQQQVKDYLEQQIARTTQLPTETSPRNKMLDEQTAMQILQEAGGDKEKARAIARDRGYTF